MRYQLLKPRRKGLCISRREAHSGITATTKGDYIMGFLAFLLLGLIAGAIAKLILPGKQGGGWFVTLLLGVVVDAFWSLSSWLLAIGGAIIVLLIYGLIVGRGNKARN
jgi:uncharacterized membrane protein YeaQ/YmgE (transglycosylase-associated protein family)